MTIPVCYPVTVTIAADMVGSLLLASFFLSCLFLERLKRKFF